MGLSTIVEWLNENEQRAYPLTVNSTRWLQAGAVAVDLYALILDARLVYTTTLPDEIELTKISKDGEFLELTVTGLPPFRFNPSDSYPAYVRNSSLSLLTLGEAAKTIYDNMTAEIAVSSVYFEPCVAIELTGVATGVNSVIFNKTTMPAGEIELAEGYQTDIQFGNQLVKLTVGRNEGIPLGCLDFFSDELDYDCGDIISSINGASPRESGGRIYLRAGEHVKIYEDPESGRVYIGLDFKTTDTCEPVILPPKT